MPVSANDPRLKRVGFAKLEGPVINYYVKKYEVVMGRKSKSTALDVVLGDNMNISRQHAKIVYNFARQVWEVVALGKNGIDVNGKTIMPDEGPQTLHSQDKVLIADQWFHFLLPKSSPDSVHVKPTPKRRQSAKQAGVKTPASSRGKRRKVTSDLHAPPAAKHSQPLGTPQGKQSARAARRMPVKATEHPVDHRARHQQYEQQFSDDEDEQQVVDEQLDKHHAMGHRSSGPLPQRSCDEEVEQEEEDDQQDHEEQDVDEVQHHPYNGHAQYEYDVQSEGADDEDDEGYEYANGEYK